VSGDQSCCDTRSEGAIESPHGQQHRAGELATSLMTIGSIGSNAVVSRVARLEAERSAVTNRDAHRLVPAPMTMPIPTDIRTCQSIVYNPARREATVIAVR
jgi:hypothetical protein